MMESYCIEMSEGSYNGNVSYFKISFQFTQYFGTSIYLKFILLHDIDSPLVPGYIHTIPIPFLRSDYIIPDIPGM